MTLPEPYYSDDAVTLYHGDCRDILPYLSADVAIFDPPYGVGMAYGDTYDDSKDIYFEWFLPTLALIRQRSNMAVFTHKVSAMRHITDWDHVGVWHKPLSLGNRLGNSMILPHWEPVFMYGIYNGVVNVHSSDVLSFNPARGGTVRVTSGGTVKGTNSGGHPVPKPLSFMSALVNVFSRTGGTVMDPFAGSGTTLRAAKDLGRRAIGIEIEERYCEMAARRCSQEMLL